MHSTYARFPHRTDPVPIRDEQRACSTSLRRVCERFAYLVAYHALVIVAAAAGLGKRRPFFDSKRVWNDCFGSVQPRPIFSRRGRREVVSLIRCPVIPGRTYPCTANVARNYRNVSAPRIRERSEEKELSRKPNRECAFVERSLRAIRLKIFLSDSFERRRFDSRRRDNSRSANVRANDFLPSNRTDL